jgi:hypothetical protein
MANPSTTGPSGIGSEVLRRAYVESASNTTSVVLTVGTDMIVTILSVIVEQNGGATKSLNMYVATDGSGANYLIRNQSMANQSTFVWSDKFVMTEGDILNVWSDSTDHDIYVSYIEQEFA